MINEQLARRYRLEVGDTLDIRLADTNRNAEVVAIYADYGRPAGEILMAGSALPAAFKPHFQSFSVTPGGVAMSDIRGRLSDTWQTSELTIRDNNSIRALASKVFSQTFLLTRAISLLTLLLAAMALYPLFWIELGLVAVATGLIIAHLMRRQLGHTDSIKQVEP